jgi:hypothetical protein
LLVVNHKEIGLGFGLFGIIVLGEVCNELLKGFHFFLFH